MTTPLQWVKTSRANKNSEIYYDFKHERFVALMLNDIPRDIMTLIFNL